MSHLGRWLTELVDGELDWAERDRVLNHLARCDECRGEANSLRALKRQMSALGDHAADESITSRLIDLACSGEVLAFPLTGQADPSYVELPVRPRSRIRRSMPGWKVLTGSAGAALTVLGAAGFLAGGISPGQPTPRVTPAVETYWMQHSYDVGQAPAAGPAPAPSGPAAATVSPTGPGGRQASSAGQGSAGGSASAAGPAPSAAPSAPAVPGHVGTASYLP
ncbi:MAG: zf-HC2 domain-containing protein [Actinomycetota bacterium]|jgi:anti-sigma factor RsiW|nr:zf-HC2 domain-containing protein [Actinomycetota bacterium]